MIKQIDFSKYSSIKCGPILDVFVITSKKTIPKTGKIIGSANNLLISPDASDLMLLSKEFDYISEDATTLTIGAATPSGKIVTYCKKHDIKGFEFLAQLPGTLGGILKMNAGLLGCEIFDNLLSIETQNSTLLKQQIPHGYRFAAFEDIALCAVFDKKRGFDKKMLEKLKDARKKQPHYPSAGSCFKNPKGDYAGRLIEAVGLKGYQRGGFCFSSQHANFLINVAQGSFQDAIWLIEEAKKRVKSKFNIELQEEIDIVYGSSNV
ncbi:MAG: UDP-N-acetylmuramate dehydrogenase [Campylobacterota bacterium]